MKDRKNLIIAKINGAKNDVTEVRITSFPTLLYFPKSERREVRKNVGLHISLASITRHLELHVA